MELMATGLGDTAIERRTGVPRGTLSAWRHGRGVALHRRQAASSRWRPTDGPRYCYLLGAYLGDGYVRIASSRAAALCVALDGRHPAVVEEVADAMEKTFPSRARRMSCQGSNVAILQISHPAIVPAFPHHGRGKKHERKIELQNWQQELTRRHPRALLRGLLHSDGSRVINRFKTLLPSGRTAHYAYVRYFFSNLSPDIRAIFCDHCDLLGIRWTQSNPRNISVAHRDSVALLDQFAGPKS